MHNSQENPFEYRDRLRKQINRGLLFSIPLFAAVLAFLWVATHRGWISQPLTDYAGLVLLTLITAILWYYGKKTTYVSLPDINDDAIVKQHVDFYQLRWYRSIRIQMLPMVCLAIALATVPPDMFTAERALCMTAGAVVFAFTLFLSIATTFWRPIGGHPACIIDELTSANQLRAARTGFFVAVMTFCMLIALGGWTPVLAIRLLPLGAALSTVIANIRFLYLQWRYGYDD